mmetsp:Transcript_33802/g.46811  ORF Transcript_33802/g.46811 Transcript_33802/m.46811 type:complete len:209 (-) Transcript_33802:519-1145(-)
MLSLLDSFPSSSKTATNLALASTLQGLSALASLASLPSSVRSFARAAAGSHEESSDLVAMSAVPQCTLAAAWSFLGNAILCARASSMRAMHASFAPREANFSLSAVMSTFCDGVVAEASSRGVSFKPSQLRRSTWGALKGHDIRTFMLSSKKPGQKYSLVLSLTLTVAFAHIGHLGNAPCVSPSTQRSTSSDLVPPRSCKLFLRTCLS